MQDDLIIQQPAGAQHLMLLFHGVGSQASDLLPLGQALAPHMADALIVSVQAPDAQGSGRQWFSLQGVTEANRPVRVAATMPRFVQAVREWQKVSGVDSASTTLIGSSQGAIMALESTQTDRPTAGRSDRTVRPLRAATTGGANGYAGAPDSWRCRPCDARAPS